MFTLFRIALALFAIALIVFGVVASISPVPFGFVFIILGAFLLIAVAPAPVRWLRRHWRWFDRRMLKIEKRLPKWLAKPLRNTDYNHDEDKDEEEEEEEEEEQDERAKTG